MTRVGAIRGSGCFLVSRYRGQREISVSAVVLPELRWRQGEIKEDIAEIT